MAELMPNTMAWKPGTAIQAAARISGISFGITYNDRLGLRATSAVFRRERTLVTGKAETEWRDLDGADGGDLGWHRTRGMWIGESAGACRRACPDWLARCATRPGGREATARPDRRDGGNWWDRQRFCRGAVRGCAADRSFFRLGGAAQTIEDGVETGDGRDRYHCPAGGFCWRRADPDAGRVARFGR